MAFRKPGRQSEPEPRRQAVKIDVATETRDAIVSRIEAGLQERDLEGRKKFSEESGGHKQPISPSWVGNPCNFCVGAKIARVPQKDQFGWLAFVGTEVHDALDAMFAPTKSQWLTETLVSVGEVDGIEVKGKVDLFDVEQATVVDYKIVGDRALETVRFSGEIKPQYEIQADLYGRGLARAGWKVRHVAIFFLPRNVNVTKPRELWSRGFWWAKPFDEQSAIDALARADRIARHIRLLGADMVLPTLERLDGCFDCKRWNYIEKEAA